MKIKNKSFLNAFSLSAIKQRLVCEQKMLCWHKNLASSPWHLSTLGIWPRCHLREINGRFFVENSTQILPQLISLRHIIFNNHTLVSSDNSKGKNRFLWLALHGTRWKVECEWTLALDIQKKAFSQKKRVAKTGFLSEEWSSRKQVFGGACDEAQ